MMARRNILAGAVLAALGLGYGFVTAGLPDRSLPDTPGPAFLPWLITAAWVGLSVALLLRGILQVRTGADVAGGYRIPPRGWLALVGFLVYLPLLPVLGFVASSVPFFAWLMWLYGERNRIVMALTALLVPAALFYLFSEGFQILLPTAPW